MIAHPVLPEPGSLIVFRHYGSDRLRFLGVYLGETSPGMYTIVWFNVGVPPHAYVREYSLLGIETYLPYVTPT